MVTEGEGLQNAKNIVLKSKKPEVKMKITNNFVFATLKILLHIYKPIMNETNISPRLFLYKKEFNMSKPRIRKIQYMYFSIMK